jgi:hypothetical protein
VRARRAALIAGLLGGLALPGAARAGRTSHLFVDEPEIVPEGDVELEQWLWANGRVPAHRERGVVDWVQWAPVFGLSPRFELSLPVEVVASPESAALEDASAVLRYRLRDRQDEQGLQPMLRLGYVQTLSSYAGPPRLEPALVVGTGHLEGVRMTAEVGARVGIPALAGHAGDPTWTVMASGGASTPVSARLRLGLELLAQRQLGRGGPAGQLLAGGSVAWSRGAAWVTAGALLGLTPQSPRIVPRLVWAVLF